MRDIIDSYARLPIGDWLAIQKEVTDASLEDIDKQVRTIAILAGITPEEVMQLPLADYKRGVAAAEYLTRPVEESRRRRPAKEYNLGGMSLRLQDMEKMNTAQYIDAQAFLGMGRDGIVPLLSVFLVPKGHAYGDGGYDVREVQRAVSDHLTTEATFDLTSFFLKRSARSILRSLRSLARAAGSLTAEQKKEARDKVAELRRMLSRLNGGG